MSRIKQQTCHYSYNENNNVVDKFYIINEINMTTKFSKIITSLYFNCFFKKN